MQQVVKTAEMQMQQVEKAVMTTTTAVAAAVVVGDARGVERW